MQTNNPIHIVCPACNAINRIPENKITQNPSCGKCHQALFSGQPMELGESQFQKIISRNDIPVLVDFWASWCGPCKMMAPAFAAAAQQLEPNFRLAKVNTEHAQQVAAQFHIQSIPTLALFKNGQEIARQPGAMGTADIVRWAQENA